jgi:hypothetical protein
MRSRLKSFLLLFAVSVIGPSFDGMGDSKTNALFGGDGEDFSLKTGFRRKPISGNLVVGNETGGLVGITESDPWYDTIAAATKHSIVVDAMRLVAEAIQREIGTIQGGSSEEEFRSVPVWGLTPLSFSGVGVLGERKPTGLFLWCPDEDISGSFYVYPKVLLSKKEVSIGYYSYSEIKSGEVILKTTEVVAFGEHGLELRDFIYNLNGDLVMSSCSYCGDTEVDKFRSWVWFWRKEGNKREFYGEMK